MPRILLYEFLTSGGLWTSSLSQHDVSSLSREGIAMLSALATDCVAAGFETVVLRDARLQAILFPGCETHDVASSAEETTLLMKLGAESDRVVLIAPEFDQLLADRCRLVVGAGGCLLSPSLEVVTLAGDKHRTAEHLAGAGVPAPRGVVVRRYDALSKDFAFPAVLKPCSGAGSQGLRLIESWIAVPAADGWGSGGPFRLERFVPGLAVSVAVLCGPDDVLPLMPCLQRLSKDGRFQYLGGALPVAKALSDRAQRLAVAAVKTLPNPIGFIGVDLVLGNDPAGAEDFVIEINPRLTTSYVGLRAAAKCNLAYAMWAVAHGQSLRDSLSFADDPLEFDADGTVRPG